MPPSPRFASYWRSNLWLIGLGLLLGFVVTFGVSYFARDLDFHFRGWNFSFWVAAQGALLVYLLIVVAYACLMNRLDERASASDGQDNS